MEHAHWQFTTYELIKQNPGIVLYGT